MMPEAPPTLLTVLPMDIATGELEDFIDIRCRIFIRDDNPDVCSDEERDVFEWCFEAHPEKIQPFSRACLDRITAEEIEKAQGQVVPWHRQLCMTLDSRRKLQALRGVSKSVRRA